MMNRQNAPYWLLAAGLAIELMAPDEKLAAQEKAAGVVTYRSIGRLLVLAGGSMIIARFVMKKSN